MEKLVALLFDVDGTLADTEEVHRLAFNETFRAHGLDWEWDRALYGRLLAVTGGKERIRHYLERFRPALLERRDADSWIALLHAEKTRRYTDWASAGQIRFRPGVARLVAEAREAGLRLGIATTTSPENVMALLESNLGPGGAECFEVIGAGDCVPAKKPAPDIYCWVMRKMDLESRSCLAFEDSNNGLKAGLGAGLATLVTPSTYTEGQDFAGACAVVSDLGEPDRPFRLIRGDTLGKRWVDVELLRHWHGWAVRTAGE